MSYLTYRLCELHAAQGAIPVEYSVATHSKVVVDRATRLGYRGSECEAMGCVSDSSLRIAAHTEPVKPVTAYYGAPVITPATRPTGSFKEWRDAVRAEREAERIAALEAKAQAEAELLAGGILLTGMALFGAAKGAKKVYRKYS